MSKLTAAFDSAIAALNPLLDLVKKWGTEAMQTQAGQLLLMVKGVRDNANRALADVVAPVQNYLNRLAQRLDVERRVSHGASTNVPNLHGDVRMKLDAEVEDLRRARPEWVRVGKQGKYQAIRRPPPAPPGHFDISDDAPGVLEGAFKTFHTAEADALAPGTVLCRVVGPGSADNSTSWMAKAEFDRLRSKPEWRDQFAVWNHWNANGEFLTYTVPPGPGMPVWRGKTASQRLEDRGHPISADDDGNFFWLDGGAEQIVVDPKRLNPEYAGPRDYTGWAYDDGDIEVNLVGVPILTRNWKE